MDLICVTKNNEPNDEKPHVYFAAHPDDKYEFVRQIGKKVLECSDCAIYYNSNENESVSDIDLEQMLLFVVPVTDKLISQASSARDIEIPFAITHYIPVLPLSKENALIEQFIQLFYGRNLRKNINDDPSWKRDLAQFTSKVSQSNPCAIRAYELGENIIESCFDVTSENLWLRLIFCSELGNIYLKSRNWNTAECYFQKCCSICQSLKTCTAMGDKSLYMLFEELKAYISLGNAQRFSLKYDKALSSYNAGLELITSNIDHFGEASTELLLNLSLIHGRIGLTYENQFKIDEAKKHYQEQMKLLNKLDNPKIANQYLAMCYDNIGRLYEVEKDYAKAQEFYVLSLGLRETIADEKRDRASFSSLATIYDRLGKMFSKDNKPHDAETHFLKGLSIHESFLQSERTIENLRGIACTYEPLANHYLSYNKLEQSELYFQKCATVCEEIFQETKTEEAAHDLSYCYDGLGRVLVKEGDYDNADIYYHKCFILRKQIAEKTGALDAKWDLARIYGHMGELNYARHDLLGAIENFLQGFDLCKQVFLEAENILSISDCIYFSSRLSSVYDSNGDSLNAKKYMKIQEELDQRREKLKR